MLWLVRSLASKRGTDYSTPDQLLDQRWWSLLLHFFNVKPSAFFILKHTLKGSINRKSLWNSPWTWRAPGSSARAGRRCRCAGLRTPTSPWCLPGCQPRSGTSPGPCSSLSGTLLAAVGWGKRFTTQRSSKWMWEGPPPSTFHHSSKLCSIFVFSWGCSGIIFLLETNVHAKHS